MNEFIELRNHVYANESNYMYPHRFLDDYITKSKKIDFEERLVVNQIQKIKQLGRKNKLDEKELGELFSFLGVHSYTDRFVVDTVLKLFTDELKPIIEKITTDFLSQRQYSSQQLYHVLDVCMECDVDLLSDEDILFMLQKYKRDAELISNLLDYMDSFKRQGFKDTIYELVTVDYPDNLKIQMINLLGNLDSMETVDQSFVRENIINEKNKVFYDSYIRALASGSEFEKQGISIMQSMFYGDFEDSGKGNNGGLAVLLKSLGEEISKDSSVSHVFTITITQELTKPFISSYGDDHVFIRLPIYLDPSVSDPFIKRELFIKRFIGNFLKQAKIKPDVFHIRFLDNASRAVAHLAKELTKKLVFTLTPDPHRNMFDGSGQLKELGFNELIEKLNKIKIGDELIDTSDGIVGIGNAAVKKELEMYFPQLTDGKINRRMKMIGEGIQLDQSSDIEGVESYSARFAEFNKAHKEFFERPVILNVGRLSVLKGQIELLKAWSKSKLSETHNLLLIGGDLERPNKEEKRVIDFFEDYVKKHPQFKDRFIHKGAMSNLDIRLLEENIMKRDFDYPHIYLCSSVKEEFGIAILEAMSMEFLTLGPIKGGVKSYMSNGENGFLIDTSNWKTIAKETENHLYDSKMNKEEFKRIQAAGQKTVSENFSINKISTEFVSFYLAVKGEENNEV
ncbi:glycosyltransferase family 4 protein [Planococcus sp. ANT_H30]|uniref:glycosyltransferase family 4 protein n=1 Tax=Planococcus sp. ANT_H30 TaxID=2597347 RepID=UPI0011EF2400|nr:glycosyltransferase family 4 protein [Planococcus sp. ANT_H30]KAA0955351.1 glycosyltransferase family 4 protein [Planococcus sp. ANT_H30]